MPDRVMRPLPYVLCSPAVFRICDPQPRMRAKSNTGPVRPPTERQFLAAFYTAGALAAVCAAGGMLSVSGLDIAWPQLAARVEVLPLPAT